jgi:thymidine phosphorylase
MVTTGNSLGMKVTAQVTEMDNPIGVMFGNSHEIVECILCLKGEGPEDTMELVYAQADSLGYDIRPNIADGSALVELRNMCIRQGVSDEDIDEIIQNPWSRLERSSDSVEIVSKHSGWVADIHALTIGEILCKLGAGRTGENPDINHGVGAELLVQRGSFIEEGTAWIRFDTESGMSSEMIDQVQGALTLSDSEVDISSRILQIIEA